MAHWRRHNSAPSTFRSAQDLEATALQKARDLINAEFLSDNPQISLDLSGLSLSTLPDEVRDLAHFCYGAEGSRAITARRLQLFLSNNQLAAFPRQLLDLGNLTVLVLRNNRLTALPQVVGQLKHLQELSVANNQLQWLPVELGRLKTLKVLNVSANPLLTEPVQRPGPAGPPSLRELCLRTATCKRLVLGPETCPQELVASYRDGQKCSHCAGGVFEGPSQLVAMEPLLGHKLPLAHVLCSHKCLQATAAALAAPS